MKFRPKLWSALVAVGAATVLASCADAPTSSGRPRSLMNWQPALIACPSQTTSTATGLIDPLLGGTVSTGDATVVLPAGAVSLPTLVTVTVPASQYLEVEVGVPGLSHVQFPVPVRITVSYARCRNLAVNRRELFGVYIDSDSKAILENLGGTTDRIAKTHTFTTDHFSGYAIAY